MGDRVYIFTRHLLHSQTADPKEQVIKSNQDVDMWRMNGDDGGSDETVMKVFFCSYEGYITFLHL